MLIALVTFFLPFSVSASQSTLARLVFKWETPAGNYTVWSMASSLMDKCQTRRLLVDMMTPSPPSSVILELANMYLVLSLWTWSPLS